MELQKIERLLLMCRIKAMIGLGNKTNAFIPRLKIDLVSSSLFLGVHGNPAIFVNKVTYRKLNKFYDSWIPNVTIAIKEDFFNASNRDIQIIGAIIHEAGHAFNVYAGLANTEANAYIFEIEVMMMLYHKNILAALFDIKDKEIQSYFNARMKYFKMEANSDPYLKSLINRVKVRFQLSHEPKLVSSESSGKSLQSDSSFFKQYVWGRESRIVERSYTKVALVN
ncbi:hypothetical protein E3983_01490 [Legionella israelensis]|uniref:Uncharacterized protein n=1 Tax=Legionella israelensis TaxID=454 RepID=A0AAX1EDF4_9GAMM|nr:hypothetical protein [Legionella israelensis]QBR83141.1 hypothetical protein E3983_01490 [Legionella israelensis]